MPVFVGNMPYNSQIAKNPYSKHLTIKRDSNGFQTHTTEVAYRICENTLYNKAALYNNRINNKRA